MNKIGGEEEGKRGRGEKRKEKRITWRALPVGVFSRVRRSGGIERP